MTRDITISDNKERAFRLTEQNVQNLEEKVGYLEAIIHNIADGLIVLDKNNNFSFLNQVGKDFFYQAETIHGNRDSFKYMQYYDMHGNELSVEDIVWSRVLKGEKAKNCRIKAVRPDKTVYFSISGNPVYDSKGDIFSAVLCFRDIIERKEAEAAERNSRAKLEAALASMTDAVFISDAEGRFIDFNDAFATFHRFKNKDECLKALAEYPDILDVFKADGKLAPLDEWAVPRALRGETVTNAEYMLRRKDTGETWIGSYSFSPITDENGVIVGSVVTGRDITHLKQAEDDIKELNKKLLKTNTMLEETNAILKEEISEHQITELKLQETLRELSETKNYLNNILESSTKYSIIGKDLNRRILSWNEGAVRNYGYTAEQIIGQDSSILHVPEDLQSGEVDKMLKLAYEQGLVEGEFQRIRKDGSRFIASVVVTRRNDSTGNPIGYLLISNDISEKKKAEDERKKAEVEMKKMNAELEEMNAELEETNATLEEEISEHQITALELQETKRVAEAANKAKSQFLANMSHEIRTPMNGILGMAQLLEMDLHDEQKEMATIIKTSGDNLLSIINDILDFSKIEAGKVTLSHEDFDIKSLINEVENLIKPLVVRKGLEYKSYIDKEIKDHIIGDSGRLKQILFNLLGNAIKFTEHGSIELAIAKGKVYEDRVQLVFLIKDTGIGIADDKIGQLFTYFTQGDDSVTKKYGGTGLGLAISKQLINFMGGEISVESELGVGSEFLFNVIFMQAEEAKEINKTNMGYVSEMPSTTSSALLLEDDYVSGMVMKKLCKRKNINLKIAISSKQAIDILKAETFDIIFMDIQMQDISGYEATKIIRDMENINNRHTPIIATTAFALVGDREKCIEAGMDDYLGKPIDADKFYAMVEKYVSKIEG